MSKLKHWLFLPVDHVLLQVPRALVASVLAALLHGGYMVLLVEVCGWNPVAASILGYLVGGLLQYILCSIWVFPNAPKNKTIGFLAFTLLSLGGLLITWGVMEAGVRLSVPYGISWFGALGLTFVWNFTSRKFLLFEKKTSAQVNHEDHADGRNVPESCSGWMASMAEVTAAK